MRGVTSGRSAAAVGGERSGRAAPVNGQLALLQAQAGALGLRALANERWLVCGFLRDAFPPAGVYLARAQRYEVLRRQLLALTERLLTDAPPQLVA